MATLVVAPAAETPAPSNGELLAEAARLLPKWDTVPAMVTGVDLSELVEFVALGFHVERQAAEAHARGAVISLGRFLLPRLAGRCLLLDCDPDTINRWAARLRADVLAAYMLAAARHYGGSGVTR
ncbi:hypothetical protein Lfu02_31470 [Longispora fulva]|uniref:Uncharacterized protein n=2 Tax=Longispora fulva TaxID=619741 RepID=A0A8J7KML3_9ACTN|nr:hypothetical protein [Longispora fulva]MBG6139281.1 hypothetical protein [Longispora fulva]GIG58775.1 hypothetical protein Lfu02_31470 [Longispora fulva]